MMTTRARAEEEFTAFTREHWPRLSRAAQLLCGSRENADDLLQEALLRTFLAWPRLQRATAFSYARRTLVNLSIDTWRRRKPTVALNDTDPADAEAQRPLASVDDRDQIVRELAGLSPRERACVILRYYLDLSEADTAAELGVSVGTVKSTCSRALAGLRPEPLDKLGGAR